MVASTAALAAAVEDFFAPDARLLGAADRSRAVKRHGWTSTFKRLTRVYRGPTDSEVHHARKGCAFKARSQAIRADPAVFATTSNVRSGSSGTELTIVKAKTRSSLSNPRSPERRT